MSDSKLIVCCMSDYAQALRFDQLREIIDQKQAFSGFTEGDINFPPTYKYDVLKTLKKSKSKKRFSLREKARSLYEEGKEIVENHGHLHVHGQEESEGKFREDKLYAHRNTSAVSSMNADRPPDAEREGSDGGDTEHASITSSYTPREIKANCDLPARKERGMSGFVGGLKNLSPKKLKTSKLFRRKVKKRDGGGSETIAITSSNCPGKEQKQAPVETMEQDTLPLPGFDPVVIAPTPKSEKSFPAAAAEANLETSSMKEIPTHFRTQSPINIPRSPSTGELLSPSRMNSLPPTAHAHVESLPSSPAIGSNSSSEINPKVHGFTASANGSETDILGRAQSGKSDGVYDSSTKQRVPSW